MLIRLEGLIMKVALVVLLAIISVSPSSNHLDVRGAKTNSFSFESGLQFLPRCKLGDEKPKFIPTEWNNKLIWLWWKGTDK
ncbi:MAG: hypothetical protein PHD83_01880 [Caldisericia bacterium]|nr:hypothetical protein [Caldisericia bacterium]